MTEVLLCIAIAVLIALPPKYAPAIRFKEWIEVQGGRPDRGCRFTDQLGIRDAGIGRAVVTYYNHVNACSRSLDLVLRSKAGIEVRVVITIGSRRNDFRETITLTPLDPQMMALPGEGHLLDGETQTFIIQGGGS